MVKVGTAARFRMLIGVAIISLANCALAQQKVGESDGLCGFENAFYSVKFLGSAAYARGGNGVVTQSGAAGFLANPANLRLNSLFEIYADGGLLREDVDYRFSTSTPFVSSLYSDASRFNMAVAAIKAGHFTAGVALSVPRKFENVLHWSFVETDYGNTALKNDSMFFAIKQWQISGGIGTELFKSLRFGFAMHVLNFQLRYQDYWTGSYAVFPGMTLSQQVLLFQVGLTQTVGDFRLAASMKSPEDTELGDRTVYGSEAGVFPVRIPAEFAAGAVYKDLISGEARVLVLDDRFYEHDLVQFGGGLHLPLVRLGAPSGSFVNIGVMHRSNPDYYGENVEQTFLNAGIELELGRLGLAATMINGSILGDGKSAVSELAIGMKFRAD